MKILKKVSYFLLLLALVGSGWILRDMIPGQYPPEGLAQEKKAAPGRPMMVPTVVTDTVKKVVLQIPQEYVGHVEALQDAELFAQVSGTIAQVHFEEGGLVQKGDLLFTIDPKIYQAQVDRADAALSRSRSSLAAAQADLAASQANLNSVLANYDYAKQYYNRLAQVGEGNVALSDLDKAKSEARRYQASAVQAQAQINQKKAQLDEITAALRQAEADLEVARINLSYTEVRAPISGKIGQAKVTVGDYVSPGTVLLATVVQVDPVRVRFSISDREYMNLATDTSQNGLKGVRARLKLANDQMYPSAGALDFISNKMDDTTGTIPLFMRFQNEGALLVPGSYVTVLFERENAPEGLVVPQEAVLTDQKGTYVFVVDAKGTAEQRYLELGDQIGGNRVVMSGLAENEPVVVSGLQTIRPGMPVKPVQAENQAPAVKQGQAESAPATGAPRS